MQTQAKPPSSSPANGSPANNKISSTSGGKARKKSTQAISGQRTAGFFTLASSARIKPPSSPSGTTISDSSTVFRSPANTIGQDAAMISGEKAINTKASDSQVETKPEGERLTLGRPK